MIAKNHFDDCPYGCNNNGKLLDTNTKQLIDCPFCSARKKELLKKGYMETEQDDVVPASTVLGIENEYLSTKYVYDVVIPAEERVFIEEESLEWQKEVSEDLYLGLTTKELPNYSVCFGIGIKGKAERIAYPMLAKAYLSGLSICKFITCTEYSMLALSSDSSLKNFFESDLCIMLINEGCTLADLSCAKGLMQTRALKGKPTIFISTWTVEACSTLLDYVHENSLMLAKPVFVKYKSSKNKSNSNYINNILGVENGRADGKTSKENSEHSHGRNSNSYFLGDLV